jgi:hypothetical protein
MPIDPSLLEALDPTGSGVRDEEDPTVPPDGTEAFGKTATSSITTPPVKPRSPRRTSFSISIRQT